MNKIGQYLNRMSLKKKFVLTFLSTTVLTLIVAILVIKVQVTNVQTYTNSRLDQLNTADYVQSTADTAQNIRLGILSYFFSLSQLLEQLELTYEYFYNSTIYTSNQNSTPLLLTIQCNSTPNYTIPALYQYSSNNTGPDFSFFDVIIPNQLYETRSNIKRLNIYFIDPNNLSSTIIRTVPATSNYSLDSTETFQSLLNQVTQGNVTVSPPYGDAFTGYQSVLMYLATRIDVNSSMTLILQIELDIYEIEKFFYKRVIYFPNVIVGYILTVGEGQYELLTVSNQQYAYNLTQIMEGDGSTLTIGESQYVVSTTSYPSSFGLGNAADLIVQEGGPYTIFLLSPISSMNLPSMTLSSFLEKYAYISNFPYALCAFLTVLTVISFSYIAANRIVYPLNKLTKAIGKFLSGTNATEIQVTLYKFEAKFQVKMLIDNVIGILEKIEGQRDSNRHFNLNDETYDFPENDCDSDFLKKMRSKALNVWPEIEQGLKSRSSLAMQS